MTERDVYKDFLLILTYGGNDREIDKAIEELQELLGDAQASHSRILYLEGLAKAAARDPERRPAGIDDPLSRGQYILLVKKGLVKACRDGDVTPGELGKLAHSVEGLHAFADALLDVPEELHAACWSDALVAPFDAPQTAIATEVSRSPSESVWNQITDMMNEWIESVRPKKLAPVLGFRSATTKVARQRFERTSALLFKDKIKEQLARLEEKGRDLPEGELFDAWSRMPWSKINNSVEKLDNWESLLQDVGNLLNDELSKEDLSALIEATIKIPGELLDLQVEMNLLGIFLNSTYIPGI